MCLLSVPLHIKCFRYNFVRTSTKVMRMSPGITTRGVGLRRISSCRWRITSWWVTLVLGWWVAVGLPVCRWWWVSNWWRNWLIHSRHLLSRRNCHRLWSEFAISFVHFNLMLCLHTSTNRAINQIRKTGQYLRSFLKFFHSGNASNNGKYTGQLLQAEHESNNAVVTLCGLYVELVLQHEASWCNRIAKAKENLGGKTKFWALTFSTSTTAGHISTAACVPWHVTIKSSFAKHIRYTGSTYGRETAIRRIGRHGAHEICVP